LCYTYNETQILSTMETCRIIQSNEVNNQTKPIKAIYLSGLQLDNLYRMDVYRYAKENPEEVKSFKNISHMVDVNKRLVGSGSYMEIN
jgi:hypothetical protein